MNLGKASIEAKDWSDKLGLFQHVRAEAMRAVMEIRAQKETPQALTERECMDKTSLASFRIGDQVWFHTQDSTKMKDNGWRGPDGIVHLEGKHVVV